MVLTSPYSPQQTPISGRGNRTTSKKAQALIHKSKLTPGFGEKKSFGCLYYVNIPKTLQQGKFSKTSSKGIFLGYDPDGKHKWRILSTNGKITKSHNFVFEQDTFPQPFNQHAPNASNMIEEEELLLCEMKNIPFSTTMEEQPHNNPNDTAPSLIKEPGKPGWESKLTSNKASKTVSADLDESNILQNKQSENMVIINHNSLNPKNWKKAMC
ncbi:hypothetical protein O181_000462 [Austropuccinia psidii MF-1]|uniref:Retroviral polymerase SH3-like domain-containing protein n=1 Tax=Austropuccinia psidii MF-1 TaxID=1389203 RepID=A0A9Q3B8Q2_9BASI|nr:hypothetical protein [Austropuccinia psidii MF-1]